MLDTFADLYAPRNTIEEDQKEVDNFTRKAKEPIRTAMRRFSCLVDKIRCLSNPISWPDIKYKMCKSVLKQIITIKTRQFIDYEEAKIKKVGGQFDMKELIELVNDFETSHSEVPTEDFTIVYCEASGEPAQWANDLQLRQKAMRQNKNLQEARDGMRMGREGSSRHRKQTPPPPRADDDGDELGLELALVVEVELDVEVDDVVPLPDAEDVEDWPPSLVAGTTCTVVVAPSPDGFVLARDGGRFQAQRAGTLVPLTDWFPSPQAVYEAASALGVAPSSTELTEVLHEGVVVRPRVRGVKASGDAGAPAAGEVSPSR
jgi:hypothetical protein